MFGRSKVKRVQMGMLVAIKCPCGEFGFNQTSLDPHEVVIGWASDDLAKCAYCGRIFIWDASLPDCGKVIGQGQPTSRR